MAGSVTHQLEAFDWWLDQPTKSRTSSSIAKQFKVSQSTAEKWRAKFGKMLKLRLEKQIGGKLKEYVKEYQQVQKTATEATVTLADIYQTKANELKLLADSGGEIDVEELNRVSSGMKTVYSLAEAASGADVAKSKAKQIDASESSTAPRLPSFEMLSDLIEADVEELESESGNDSANDNLENAPENTDK